MEMGVVPEGSWHVVLAELIVVVVVGTGSRLHEHIVPGVLARDMGSVGVEADSLRGCMQRVSG